MTFCWMLRPVGCGPRAPHGVRLRWAGATQAEEEVLREQAPMRSLPPAHVGRRHLAGRLHGQKAQARQRSGATTERERLRARLLGESRVEPLGGSATLG